jgi:hypothetical protein
MTEIMDRTAYQRPASFSEVRSACSISPAPLPFLWRGERKRKKSDKERIFYNFPNLRLVPTTTPRARRQTKKRDVRRGTNGAAAFAAQREEENYTPHK